MGQMIDYVSQFEVDESYEQINYQETPYRVTPLEYSDLIKWVTNRKEGLPAYIKVNMVTQEQKLSNKRRYEIFKIRTFWT